MNPISVTTSQASLSPSQYRRGAYGGYLVHRPGKEAIREMTAATTTEDVSKGKEPSRCKYFTADGSLMWFGGKGNSRFAKQPLLGQLEAVMSACWTQLQGQKGSQRAAGSENTHTAQPGYEVLQPVMDEGEVITFLSLDICRQALKIC